MITQNTKPMHLSIPHSLKLIGIIGGAWALMTILGAVLAYIPDHPDFSLFTTYLSDMGAAPVWPQIIFNAGTLIAVPIRYLFLVLIAVRLRQLGAGKAFVIATLVVGFLSTAGTALMTATPYTVSLIMHKIGIGFYFLGVVVLQTMIFLKEWSLKSIPKILPLLSLLMVVLFIIFVTLMVQYDQGAISRNTPVIWEWLSILTSIIWMLAQSIVLGKTDHGTALLQ